jgi:hypothetical protein
MIQFLLPKKQKEIFPGAQKAWRVPGFSWDTASSCVQNPLGEKRNM